MRRPRRRRGLAARFFLAQLLVVAAGLGAAIVVAFLVGPPIFHEHLLRAGVAHDTVQLLHVERAYRDATLAALGVAVLTASGCALAVSWLLTRRIHRPLSALIHAARDMTHGRYDIRVPALGAGVEVEELTEAFNTMAGHLERTEDTRRRLLSDLAHEMRTPLSVLAVYCEALQDGVSSWNDATNELMSEQLDRLTRLVEDIHDVSRAEEGRITLERTTIPAAELLRGAVTAHREAYATKGVDLRLGRVEAPVVSVDPQRMGQVLGNLLTNALRHTPPGGTVTAAAAACGPRHVTLHVTDTGEGIAGEHQDRVFERFYRGDSARNRDHGGSGIGLTISKALVEAHGGTLTVDSPGPGRGATFTIDLPAHQGHPPLPITTGRHPHTDPPSLPSHHPGHQISTPHWKDTQ